MKQWIADVPPSRISFVVPVQTDSQSHSHSSDRDFLPEKSKQLNYQLKKVYVKLGGIADSLATTTKESSDNLAKSAQGFKALAREQTSLASQMGFDFQQQATQLTRSFQNALNDVETSFRNAVQAISLQRAGTMMPMPAAPMYPMPPISLSYTDRPRRSSRRVIEEGGSADSEMETRLRVWQRDGDRAEAAASKIATRFKRIKQNFPRD
jgi:hypothetical protein